MLGAQLVGSACHLREFHPAVLVGSRLLFAWTVELDLGKPHCLLAGIQNLQGKIADFKGLGPVDPFFPGFAQGVIHRGTLGWISNRTFPSEEFDADRKILRIRRRRGVGRQQHAWLAGTGNRGASLREPGVDQVFAGGGIQLAGGGSAGGRLEGLQCLAGEIIQNAMGAALVVGGFPGGEAAEQLLRLPHPPASVGRGFGRELLEPDIGVVGEIRDDHFRALFGEGGVRPFLAIEVSHHEQVSRGMLALCFDHGPQRFHAFGVGKGPSRIEGRSAQFHPTCLGRTVQTRNDAGNHQLRLGPVNGLGAQIHRQIAFLVVGVVQSPVAEFELQCLGPGAIDPLDHHRGGILTGILDRFPDQVVQADFHQRARAGGKIRGSDVHLDLDGTIDLHRCGSRDPASQDLQGPMVRLCEGGFWPGILFAQLLQIFGRVVDLLGLGGGFRQGGRGKDLVPVDVRGRLGFRLVHQFGIAGAGGRDAVVRGIHGSFREGVCSVDNPWWAVSSGNMPETKRKICDANHTPWTCLSGMPLCRGDS